MLHLFNEVYVGYDTEINLKYYRIVISEVNGVMVDESFDQSRLLAYSRSFEDLVGPEKQFENFKSLMNFLSTKSEELNVQINIYLDKSTFIKFTVMWYKLLFNQATADAIFDYVKSYQIQRDLENLSKGVNDIPFLISKEEFVEAFNNANEDFSSMTPFVTSITPVISTELMLASYLANGSLKNLFVERLRYQTLKDIDLTMDQWKSEIIQLAFRHEFREQMGLGSYTIENIESIVNDPGFDSFFKIHSAVKENLSNNTNVWDNITDAEIDETVSKLFNWTKTIYSVDNSGPQLIGRIGLLKTIKTYTTDVETWFNSIINFEIENAYGSFSISTSMFNIVFVNYILDPIRTSNRLGEPTDTSNLLPYVIRGAV